MLAPDRHLLGLDAAFGVDGEGGLVAREVAGGQVRDQVHQPQALLGVAVGGAEIPVDQGAKGGVVEVLGAGTGNQEPARDVLDPGERLVVVGGEVELRDVDQLRVRHRDAVDDVRFAGRLACHPAADLRVADELRELVADVPRPQHAVVFRHQVRGADEQVDQRQLVADRGEAVELHESLRERSRHRYFAVQEDPVPRHLDVVEDGQCLHHLAPRAERLLERIAAAAVPARQHGQAGCVRRHRTGDRIGFFAFGQVARRKHDDLVGIRRDRRMHFRPPQRDAVVVLGDDANVVVRMGLLRRPGRPVALDVGLRDGDGKVPVAAMRVERFYAGQVPGAHRPVHMAGNETQREEGVGADFLDEHDQGAAMRGRPLDQGAAPKQVVRRARDRVVAGVRSVRAVDHREFALRRIFGHPVVDGGMFHRESDYRVSRHVVHPFPPVPDGASVPQALHVLFRRHQWHRHVLLRPVMLASRPRKRQPPGPRRHHPRGSARAPPLICLAVFPTERAAGFPTERAAGTGECRCR